MMNRVMLDGNLDSFVSVTIGHAILLKVRELRINHPLFSSISLVISELHGLSNHW